MEKELEAVATALREFSAVLQDEIVEPDRTVQYRKATAALQNVINMAFVDVVAWSKQWHDSETPF